MALVGKVSVCLLARLLLGQFSSTLRRHIGALLSGVVGIEGGLPDIALGNDLIVTGWVHRRLGRHRWGRSGHGHRHRHLRMLRVRQLRLLGWIARSCRIVARHRLRHRLWHRIHSRSRSVLLHDHPLLAGRQRRCHRLRHRIRSYVVLGGRDNDRCGNDGTCVATPLAAHAAQREEHKQYEADHNRNEDVHGEGWEGGG